MNLDKSMSISQAKPAAPGQTPEQVLFNVGISGPYCLKIGNTQNT